MSSSREDSPDWLRSFEPPTRSVTTLLSDSELSGDKSLTGDESDGDDACTISAIVMKSDANKSSTKKATTKQVKVDDARSSDKSPIKDENDGEDACTISDLVVKPVANKSSNKKTTKILVKVDDEMPAKRRKTARQKKRGAGSEVDEDVKKEESTDEQMETPAPNHQIWALSSDSETDASVAQGKKEPNEEPATDESLKLLAKEEKIDNEESVSKATMKGKSPKKRMKKESVKAPEKEGESVKAPEEEETKDNMKVEGEVGDTDVPEKGTHEKHVEPHGSSSRLPLVLSEKVYRSKALIECEGESIDLGGDMGAVGRVIIPEAPSNERELFLDLKGTIYKTTIVPSRTFCVVSIGQSEAKIEAIMNDFIQLTPQSNVYDAETMVEGTLDGFSFDSEDEDDKTTKDVKGDQNEGAEEKPNGKAKGKGKAEKKLGATQKKAKAAGGKQPKKRKPPAAKKAKSKK